MKISRLIKSVAVALVVVSVFAGVGVACPTCKDNLADPQHMSIARGYFYSILFMMSMPFAILGTFGSMAYLSIRRARGRQELDGFLSPDESSLEPPR